MQDFIRFQTSLRCPDTARALGIFGSAYHVRNARKLDAHLAAWLDESLRWFEEHLQVPREEDHDWRSIFWFRTDSQRFIDRVWDMVAVLQEEGVHVKVVRSREPGQIVYVDDHQIAAIPPRRRARHGYRQRTAARK